MIIDCKFYDICEQSEKEVKYCMNCSEFQKRFVKFVYIDDWNRPVFKVLEKGYYLSDLHNLFDYGTTEKQIKDFYKDKELNRYLTYHGKIKDCEPMGCSMCEYNIELV